MTIDIDIEKFVLMLCCDILCWRFKGCKIISKPDSLQIIRELTRPKEFVKNCVPYSNHIKVFARENEIKHKQSEKHLKKNLIL